jgi:hypothetical protein
MRDGKRDRYALEFKQEAVRLVESGFTSTRRIHPHECFFCLSANCDVVRVFASVLVLARKPRCPDIALGPRLMANILGRQGTPERRKMWCTSGSIE